MAAIGLDRPEAFAPSALSMAMIISSRWTPPKKAAPRATPSEMKPADS
ncbi:hypothetical protein [Bosea sp. WAO]|nr:hypothetical protein [Bosea sp. WAO]